MSALSRLLQLADTAFPTGAFAHSLGLEAEHAAGGLRDEHDLERLLRRHLTGLATSDLVAVRAAHAQASAAAPDLDALIVLDREVDATRVTRETREASRATGERFLIAAVELLDDAVLAGLHAAVGSRETPGTLPVAWGVACAAVGVDAEAAARAQAFTALSALAAAGQRLVPLGGVATQRALWRSGDAIDDAVRLSAAIDPAEPCSFVPEVDVRSAQHERQRVRLFIS
ncbi:urease accessory UreF family protein [Patulibacter sp. NPDC049589]|uniref:urease accessory protein UreF n=1 Tax=Patulibacter sp. NPDC049589 TaxID=3154731 RepID=UPI00342B3E1E